MTEMMKLLDKDIKTPTVSIPSILKYLEETWGMVRWWMGEIKEKQIELLQWKIYEMNIPLYGINTTLGTAEEMINKCENIIIGISWREAQKERRMKTVNRASEPMG